MFSLNSIGYVTKYGLLAFWREMQPTDVYMSQRYPNLHTEDLK